MTLLPGADRDPRIAEAERLLRHYIRSNRLETVVHRQAAALNGRSLHELARDDPDDVLEAVRTMLDLHRAD